MKDVHIPNFKKIVKTSSKILKETGTKKQTKTQVIAMFDLVGSTSLKLKKGHEAGMKSVRYHNSICTAFIDELGGRVVKELGDGILASFNDPIQACVAAVNIRDAAKMKRCSSKAALVLGVIEESQTETNSDVLGAAVDFNTITLEAELIGDTGFFDLEMTRFHRTVETIP